MNELKASKPIYYETYAIDFLTILIGLILLVTLLSVGYIVVKRINKVFLKRFSIFLFWFIKFKYFNWKVSLPNPYNQQPVRYVANPLAPNTTPSRTANVEYGYDNNNDFRNMPSALNLNHPVLMKSLSETENDLFEAGMSNHASISSNMSMNRNDPNRKALFNENFSYDFSTGSNLPESLRESIGENAQGSSNRNSDILVDFTQGEKANEKNWLK